MSTFYLVRHGEKALERLAGLTSVGRKQTQEVGEALKRKNVELIVSSPSKRAVETAELIGISLRKSYTIDKRLRERFEFGESENQTYQDYMKNIDASNLDRNFILPNGQSSLTKAHQMRDIVKTLSKHKKPVVLITHAGAILDYLRSTFSYNEFRDVIPNFSSWKDIYTPYASITTIEVKKNVSILIGVGDTSHLTEKGVI